jgi:hypothetical protein
MEHFSPIVYATGVFWFLLIGISGHPPSAQDFFSPAVEAKLDSRLLQRVRESETGVRPDEQINVLVRTASEMNADQETLLQKKGAAIKSKLGSIVSAAVPAGSVREIAALDFVLRIELAKKLKEREKQP